MSTSTSNKIAAPVYAVAGAGDLAYRQLLKLPAVTAELREDLPARVAELRSELPARVEQLRAELPTRAAELPNRVAELSSELPARVEHLRAEFPTAMTTLVAEAYQVYNGLVARGERVVEGRRGNGKRVAKSDAAPKPTRVPAKVGKATKPAAKGHTG